VRFRSLKSKALVVLSVPLLMLVTTTALTFRALQQSAETQERVGHAYYVKERISLVLDDLVDIETGVRGYLLTGQGRFLDPYWRGSLALAGDVQYLQVAVEGQGTELALLQLRELAKRRLDLLDRLRMSADARRVASDHTAQMLRRGRLVMEEIRELLGTMTTQQQTKVDHLQGQAEGTRRRAFMVAVGGAPAGMLLALVVVMMFNERTVRRLARVEDNARRLEQGVPMVASDEAEDEIGRLGRALVRSGTRSIELQDELHHLASVDVLTTLANRRGLMPLLDHQLELARRHHEPVALLFIDLDGLKTVNDTLGHSVGDEMIAETGSLLRDVFRASDVPARIGGDEFCVMLTADSATATDVIVARLHAAIDGANRLPGRPYALSVSVGVAAFDPERPTSAEGLIAEADRRMYEHKRSKRQPVTG